MSTLPRILVYGRPSDPADDRLAELRQEYEVVQSDDVQNLLELLQSERFAGVFLLGEAADHPAVLLEASGILDRIPDAVVLLDCRLQILWANVRFSEMVSQALDDGRASYVGESFYDAFGTPEILGPDFCPFHTALGSGETARSTLRLGEKTYFEVQANPVTAGGGDESELLVAVVRDVSSDEVQRQKLNAIYQAGLELGDLSPQEVLEMSLQDRIELLKSKILHYTEDLLEFETVEIRLVDKVTRSLEPLLAVGMQPMARDRQLCADPQGNGVTGFVAATGKSYLCEDTENDPLYLPGAAGARSSLTVPLILHDEILGTFNVESPRPGAFDEFDLQFLELFSREVAVALNTLELLVAEKTNTATESTELVLREISEPVDEILNDVTWVLERYIGHEPNVSERLQKVLKHTRDIRQLVHKVGETMTPKTSTHATLPPRPRRPKLVGKRILVADSDESVRRAAHELLGRFGCEVETAHSGEEARMMVRNVGYDAVIADIRLPDMNGYECFRSLKDVNAELPVILMTGFGYDPSHAIVKARQDGLRSVLYKPFRLDQLLGELEKAVGEPVEASSGSA